LKIVPSDTICVGLEQTNVQILLAHPVWFLAVAFTAAGALALLAPREAGPRGFREVTALLLFAAAALVPVLRLAGLALAAFVLFLCATTLLHRRRYAAAAPVIAMLFALIPVSLTI
jgi:hypothetical protein